MYCTAKTTSLLRIHGFNLLDWTHVSKGKFMYVERLGMVCRFSFPFELVDLRLFLSVKSKLCFCAYYIEFGFLLTNQKWRNPKICVSISFTVNWTKISNLILYIFFAFSCQLMKCAGKTKSSSIKYQMQKGLILDYVTQNCIIIISIWVKQLFYNNHRWKYISKPKMKTVSDL